MDCVEKLQEKAICNWTGFSDQPTTIQECANAINKIPKKFHYIEKKSAAPKIPINPGVSTELAENMGLLSGEEARMISNNIKRLFYREVEFVSTQ